MNFLIQSTTLNYWANHNIALHLSRIYPDSRFGILLSAHGDKRKELEAQDDLKYEFIIDMQDIELSFLGETFSAQEIEEFEKTIPEKSLWRFIAMDRYFGRAFCKGATRFFDNRQLVSGQIKEEHIFKVACGYIRFFYKVIQKLNADVVLFFPGFHSMMTPILEQVCKNEQVHHIALVGARLGNNYIITNDIRCTFPQIEETYKELIQAQSPQAFSKGKQHYSEIMAAVDKDGYSYHHEMVKKILAGMTPKKDIRNSYPVILLKSFLQSLIGWGKELNSKRKKGARLSPYGFSYLIKKTVNSLFLTYQSKRLKEPEFYDAFDVNEKYLYYPLTGQPEYATQIMDNMWINQLTIIEALAKSVPHDWKIYIKEHPATVGWRVRPFSFYKELRAYPNVRLIPINLENNLIVRHSQMVVALSSTAGWEAFLFHHKPIINFSHTLYNITGLSTQCFDLTKLANLISKEHERINIMPLEERKRRIIALLSSILEHAIEVDNPLGTFKRTVSDKEIEANTANIAGGIQRYLKTQGKARVC